MADSNLIQSAPPEVIQTEVERIVIGYKGPLDSDQMNRFAEQVMADIIKLAEQGNVTAKAVRHAFHTLQLESDTSRQKALAQQAQLDFNRRISALRGERVTHWADIHDTAPLSFVPNTPISRRCNISSQYGQATVPMNALESRLYSVRLLHGGTVTPATLIASTTGSFDKGLGDGVTDYEYGGTIEETDPKNMANGNNDRYWRRRAIFPLHSDVSEVECEGTITIPENANLHANVMTAHPYPLGNVDVTGLWTSPDLSGSFTPVSGFDQLLNAGKTRWFFPSQKVAQVKFRLRQRNWFEEEGRKVFEYGLQELGLQLVQWDKHYDVEATQLSDNHSFVIRFDAEPGFRFYRLYGLYTDPDWTLEPADNRHLHFVVASDASGTQPLWNSDTQSAPQTLSAPIELGSLTTLYVIVTMNWVETAGVGSPFQVNTTPFLKGLGLDVTYVRSS